MYEYPSLEIAVSDNFLYSSDRMRPNITIYVCPNETVNHIDANGKLSWNFQKVYGGL